MSCSQSTKWTNQNQEFSSFTIIWIILWRSWQPISTQHSQPTSTALSFCMLLSTFLSHSGRCPVSVCEVNRRTEKSLERIAVPAANQQRNSARLFLKHKKTSFSAILQRIFARTARRSGWEQAFGFLLWFQAIINKSADFQLGIETSESLKKVEKSLVSASKMLSIFENVINI